MQPCWARPLSKTHRLRCSGAHVGCVYTVEDCRGLCRLAYIWQEAWCNLSDVQSWVCRFEPTHSAPIPRRTGSLTEEKLTKYVMSRAVRGFGHRLQTHTHTFQKHTQTCISSCKIKKKRRQLCSLGIIRAHAEPGRQSLASWEQGSPDEASLFKSPGWAESVSVDGIAPGDMQGLGGKKEDGEAENCRWTEWQEGVFEEMKGQRIRA